MTNRKDSKTAASTAASSAPLATSGSVDPIRRALSSMSDNVSTVMAGRDAAKSISAVMQECVIESLKQYNDTDAWFAHVGAELAKWNRDCREGIAAMPNMDDDARKREADRIISFPISRLKALLAKAPKVDGLKDRLPQPVVVKVERSTAGTAYALAFGEPDVTGKALAAAARAVDKAAAVAREHVVEDDVAARAFREQRAAVLKAAVALFTPSEMEYVKATVALLAL